MILFKKPFFIFALPLLMFAATAFSQEPISASDVSVQKGFTLALDNADITDLIRWASEVTHKNIILHPNVQGRVTVVSGDPMSKEEAYEAFLSILQVHGLTVIQENGSLKVIPDAKAKESSIPLMENTSNNSAEEIVVKIISLKNIAANVLMTLIRPLIPQTGYLAAYPETNTLIIADRKVNIGKILGIINSIDQAGTIEIELIRIEYADAKSIISILKELLTRQTTRGNPSSSLNLAVDERSNSILITGDPVTRQQIRKIIKRLDQPLQRNGNTQVFRIQYATATNLVPIIESFSSAAGVSKKNAGNTDIDFSIQAHEQLNALIITAPPSQMNTIRAVIDQLDVPRSQVMVEALIVEISEELSKNIGVEWQSNQPGATGESVFGGFNSFPPEVSPLSMADDVVSLGTGLSLGYFRGGSLRGIVNMLAGETDANILSTPTIVALDNEEAEILVGSSVPFITGSQQRAGDTDPFQTIQREDIGITLKIKPRINNNDSVTLSIEQSVESIAPSTTGTADIVTNKRKIKTRVLINNDEILVLGGLMRDEVSKGESRVPFLGKIPILGHLFKSKSTKSTKTNLMVFIHPQILQTGTHLNDISRKKYNHIRDQQLEFDTSIEHFLLPGNAPVLPPLEDSSVKKP